MVTSLAALTLPDGHCLLASASQDHTVSLWDPTTGKPFGNPLTGHTNKVNTLAALKLPDGRCLLASGREDRTVRVWDIPSGRSLHVWGIDSPSRTLACVGGRLVVAVDAGLLA